MTHKISISALAGPLSAGVLALFLGLVLSLGGCSDSDDKLVIGAVLPTTGDAATFGQNAANGAQLAIEIAVKQNLLDGRKVQLAVEDSRGNPVDAASGARKLLDVDGATLMIGDVTSAGTHALIPIVTKAQVPLISPSASDPALSGASPFFTRVWPSDVYEASVIGKYALEKGYSRIAIIYANSDYGVGMVKALRKVVPANKIALDIPVERAVADFRPSLKRAQIANADAFFVVLYPEDGKRYLAQSAGLGIVLPILATATMEDPMIVDAPGAEHVVFASPVPPNDDAEGRTQFLNAYKERFGKDAGILSDTGYDSAMILMKAWVAANKQGPQAVAEAIRAFKDYPGISGTMTFDKNGDVNKPYGLKTVRDGAFAWMQAGQ